MALGSLVDVGADVDEVRALLNRLPLPGWHLEFEDGIRGGIACTRAVVGGDDVVVRTHGVIAALIEEAALPPALRRVPSGLLQAGLGRVRPPSSAHRPGALPRGRRARRHHRHRRHRRCTRGARRRRGVRLRRWQREWEWYGARTATLPNPAPAMVRLLEGIPSYGRDVRIELYDAYRCRLARRARPPRSASSPT